LLRELGRSWGLPTVLVTFDPHPRMLLRPESAPPLLSALDDRMQLLAKTGAVDYCVVLPFDRRRSAESADEFVRDTLIGQLGMCSLVVGENFACGRGRTGNIPYLKELGLELGYAVHPVPLRAGSDSPALAHCSSSETRRLIQMGDIGGAAAMLDRPHEVSCTVAAHGVAAYGAAIGPMLELVMPDAICMPPAGRYAGMVRKKGDAGSWLHATLQVREDHGHCARFVHLLAEEEIECKPGDVLACRFLRRLTVPGRNPMTDTVQLSAA
jgi:riboflavin kinase/FMN adenylyltransferase